MKSIALFGTSADPPTAGHGVILRWLSQHYDWVAVWAADNPFKSHQTLLRHRAAMLGLLIKEGMPRHNVGLHQELSSFRTVETLEKARQRWGSEAALTLVIGADLVSQLPRWYRFEDLLQYLSQLLVVPRPGYVMQDNDLERLRQLGVNVAIADLTVPDVSSTAYRENGDTHALTPPVEAYIHRKHLYKCQDAALRKLQIR